MENITRKTDFSTIQTGSEWIEQICQENIMKVVWFFTYSEGSPSYEENKKKKKIHEGNKKSYWFGWK